MRLQLNAHTMGAVESMSTSTIYIRTSSHRHRQPVTAHEFGPWAAHPIWNQPSTLWTVTHVPSGLCLQNKGIPRLIAMKLARTLGREVPLVSKRAVMGRHAHVREIWHRCGAGAGRKL